jgi:hypothetical protein
MPEPELLQESERLETTWVSLIAGVTAAKAEAEKTSAVEARVKKRILNERRR